MIGEFGRAPALLGAIPGDDSSASSPYQSGSTHLGECRWQLRDPAGGSGVVLAARRLWELIRITPGLPNCGYESSRKLLQKGDEHAIGLGCDGVIARMTGRDRRDPFALRAR